MNYVFRDFYFEINANVLYLSSKCFTKEKDNEKFYGVIETSKAFDISKDLSNVNIAYNKSEMINKEDLDYKKYDNYISLPVPDKVHFILLPIEGVVTVFNHSLIESIYNNIGNCIDEIEDFVYNNKQSSGLNLNDLDYLKSYLDEIQTIVLTKFKNK